MLALVAVLGLAYLSMINHLLQDSSRLIVSFASLASIWIVFVRTEKTLMKQDFFGHALLGAAHVLAMLGLYRLTTDIGSLAVSASWLFYAVGVILFAFMRRDNDLVKSALFVLGFAAAKALLYDAASAPTVVRIFCLLLTGVVLYGCGFFMRKAADWKK
jgi:predicted membrane channel-forming protein YqfA (hemolysin III family)